MAFVYTAGMTNNDKQKDDGSPKFGRLLLVCLAAMAFCGVLTYIMATYFPDF
jgi:hypothetical protein